MYLVLVRWGTPVAAGYLGVAVDRYVGVWAVEVPL
jgi:hypothetical protein